MVAPPVAKAKMKEHRSSNEPRVRDRAAFRARCDGGGTVEQVQLLQRTVGNRATLWLLSQSAGRDRARGFRATRLPSSPLAVRDSLRPKSASERPTGTLPSERVAVVRSSTNTLRWRGESRQTSTTSRSQVRHSRSPFRCWSTLRQPSTRQRSISSSSFTECVPRMKRGRHRKRARVRSR